MKRTWFLFRSVYSIGAPYYGPRSLLILPLVLSLGSVVATIFWRRSRSRQIIAGWAAQNTFQILRCEARWFFRGPMAWSTARGQAIYFVTVRDQNGLERSGWLRCGGWFTGLWADKVQVQWLDLTNVWMDESTLLARLPSHWVWVLVLLMVLLGALIYLLLPKPTVPPI